jgi:hypothetical protein
MKTPSSIGHDITRDLQSSVIKKVASLGKFPIMLREGSVRCISDYETWF